MLALFQAAIYWHLLIHYWYPSIYSGKYVNRTPFVPWSSYSSFTNTPTVTTVFMVHLIYQSWYTLGLPRTSFPFAFRVLLFCVAQLVPMMYVYPFFSSKFSEMWSTAVGLWKTFGCELDVVPAVYPIETSDSDACIRKFVFLALFLMQLLI